MPQAQDILNKKVKSDSESRINDFEESRRIDRMRSIQKKVESRIQVSSRSANKSINVASSLDTSSFIDFKDNQRLVFALGMTLCLINDFIDLVLWQNVLLVNMVLDLTSLFLLVLLLSFFSKSYPLTVFLIITVFMLEIVPVLGVIPFWTIGMVLWYTVNRKK